MEEVEDVDLPNRLIAAGEEPLGDRINYYSKMKRLCSILDALDETEKDYLRRTQFRKLLDFPTQPAWSASFGIFLLSRQLDVFKKNEIWFIFAGTPVRFSLREFYLLTGLICNKYPTVPKKRKKNTAGKKIPYYSTLFGLEEDVTVDRVITMLKKRIVTDEEMRKKYACLALLDGYVLPTSHYPKISKEHAEMMENFETFLGYPWGRSSFEVMIKSIKERDIEQLATTCVAVQGLVYVLQLTVIHAAPSIQEGPIVEGSVGSDSEDESEEGTPKRVAEPFKLGHAKEIDQKCTAKVDTIIYPQCEPHMLSEDLTWSDEEEDVRVDNMLRLAKEGFKFTNDMFPGGCIPSQLEVAPKKQKRAPRGQAVRTRKSSKSARNQTFAPQASSSRDASSGPRFVDIDSLSRMLDVKMASQQQRIIDGVIGWFENNISVSGDKAGASKGGSENHPQNSKSTGQTNTNLGGRGYVFSQPSPVHGQGTTENNPTDDFDANPNPSVSLHGGLGVNDIIDGVTSFYREGVSGNYNASSPVHPHGCDDVAREANAEVPINAANAEVPITAANAEVPITAANAEVPITEDGVNVGELGDRVKASRETSFMAREIGAQGNVESHSAVMVNQSAMGSDGQGKLGINPAMEGNPFEMVGVLRDAVLEEENERTEGTQSGQSSPMSTEGGSELEDVLKDGSDDEGEEVDSMDAEDESTANVKDAGTTPFEVRGGDLKEGDVTTSAAEEGGQTLAVDAEKGVTHPINEVRQSTAPEAAGPFVSSSNDAVKDPFTPAPQLAESSASSVLPQPKFVSTVHPGPPHVVAVSQNIPVVGGSRRSVRARTISSKLDGRYQFDKKTKAVVGIVTPPPVSVRSDPEERFQNSMKKLKRISSLSLGGDVNISYKDILELMERRKPMSTKVMDALINFSRHLLRTDEPDGVKLRVDVLDTSFVGGLSRLYSKFIKTLQPDLFKFPPALLDAVLGRGSPDRLQLFTEADYLYLPFNFEKKHWVALCVDFHCARIVVLDCNFKMCNDFKLKNAIKPIAVMLPYLIKQAAGTESMRRMLPIEFSIERSLCIPQITSTFDSGIMSIFLIHAHATGGLEECFDFDLSSLEMESKKLVSALILAGGV